MTSIEASTLSRLVTRLTRRGLVSRARSAKSNREVAVSLSPKGKALVARLIPIAKDYESTAIAGLTPEEMTILKRCLRLVYVNMKNRPTAVCCDADAAAAGPDAERVRREAGLMDEGLAGPFAALAALKGKKPE